MTYEIINKTNTDPSLWNALKNTLYPGAKDESIVMVLNYCKAAGLDPMQKPVHLVPMPVKTENGSVWRDAIMPGIGLYRIQAARSGLYAGISEPEYGEDVTETIGATTITYPKWCKVTIKKQLNGQIIEFTAKEYWKENYASMKDKITPNAMWAKRPYGQLAKCTEAQALRKAFPEIVSSEPTAEEMEGKHIDFKDVTSSVGTETSHETRHETITLYDSWKSKELELAISDACKWINNKLDAIHDHDSLQVYEQFVLSNRSTLKLITSKISKDEILSMSQKVKTKRDLYSAPFTADAPFMDYTPGQTSEEIRELKAENAASVGMDDSKAEDYEQPGDYEYAESIKL